MARQEFPARVLVARFKHCGGRCEGVLDSGERCNALLVPGRWHGDHDNPDGLTGKPTFENCRCLCIPCHTAKTKIDVARIAKAKRVEARHIGAVCPKGQLRSPGFPSSGKKRTPVSEKFAHLPRSRLYEDAK